LGTSGPAAAQYVKPYVKRNKNDAADAERSAKHEPGRRCGCPVKTAEQQAALMLAACATADSPPTQVSHAIRGYAAEFGLTAAKG